MQQPFIVERGLDFLLIDVRRDCDFTAASTLTATLSSTGDRTAATIVDLTSCDFIDSTGLGVLVTQQRERRNLVVVLPPGHRLRRVFEVTKLHEYLSLVPSREAALERVR